MQCHWLQHRIPEPKQREHAHLHKHHEDWQQSPSGTADDCTRTEYCIATWVCTIHYSIPLSSDTKVRIAAVGVCTKTRGMYQRHIVAAAGGGQGFRSSYVKPFHVVVWGIPKANAVDHHCGITHCRVQGTLLQSI